MDEIEKLRAQLADAQQQRNEAQYELRREQRRREEAEASAQRAAALSAPQCLSDFLESCHQLALKTRVVTDPLATTGGSITNPISRMRPQHIHIWNGFSDCQTSVWDGLALQKSLWTQAAFPSSNNISFISTQIRPIGSENGLRVHQALTVENPVKSLFDYINNEAGVPGVPSEKGNINFENQVFKGSDDRQPGQALRHLSMEDSNGPSRRNRRADQFCVYQTGEGGGARPVVAIEYKAPHKLTESLVTTGLSTDIDLERDIIDVHGDTPEFLSRSLLAAVVTQLFSYMIDSGVRYGYISTGMVYVFVCIPDKPDTVYCSVNIPKEDHGADHESRLQRTAVSQVFAFIKQALSVEPVEQGWVDEARRTLKRWKVEYYDILATIPETVRKSKPTTPYKPGKWKEVLRSPIVLRKRCKLPATDDIHDPADDTEEDGSESPTQRPRTRAQTRAANSVGQSSHPPRRGKRRVDGRKQDAPEEDASHPAIQGRPYCSHKCLLGLSRGFIIDKACPNARMHGSQHISRQSFLDLVRTQLAIDRGKNADCQPLYIHGSRGAILKVCLTSHGYTLVGKGMTTNDRQHLQNEERIYADLAHLQGTHVPVCLGSSNLKKPYYYQGAELTSVLFMSWGGKPLPCVLGMLRERQMADRIRELATCAIRAIHDAAVLHRDAEPRNILWDESRTTLMVIDFERSSATHRRPLGLLSANRKRKHEDVDAKVKSRSRHNAFEAEMARAICSIEQAFR